MGTAPPCPKACFEHSETCCWVCSCATVTTRTKPLHDLEKLKACVISVKARQEEQGRHKNRAYTQVVAGHVHKQEQGIHTSGSRAYNLRVVLCSTCRPCFSSSTCIITPLTLLLTHCLFLLARVPVRRQRCARTASRL